MSTLHTNGYKPCPFGDSEKVQTGDDRPTFRMALGDGLKKIRRRRQSTSDKKSDKKFYDQDAFTLLSKVRV